MLCRVFVFWLIQGSPNVAQLTSCVYSLIGEVNKLRTEISRKQKRKVVYLPAMLYMFLTVKLSHAGPVISKGTKRFYRRFSLQSLSISSSNFPVQSLSISSSNFPVQSLSISSSNFPVQSLCNSRIQFTPRPKPL